MTENSHPNSRPDQPESGPDPSPAPRANPWPSRIIPAATFVVGLVLGGVLVGAAVGGDDDETASGAESSATPTTAADSSTGDTVVTVPAACQEAGDNMREAFSLLRGSTQSVENFKPDKIVDLLNRLEDIDNETRPLLDECTNVDVSESALPSASASSSS